MVPTEPRAILHTARTFARDHLVPCARDLLTWRTTGVLPAGRLRDLGEIFRPLSDHDALQLAERAVERAALEYVVAGVASPPSTLPATPHPIDPEGAGRRRPQSAGQAGRVADQQLARSRPEPGDPASARLPAPTLHRVDWNVQRITLAAATLALVQRLSNDRWQLQSPEGAALAEPSFAAPKEALRYFNGPLALAEGISGAWHYHLSRAPKAVLALCGARTMATAVPLAAWGTRSHLNERYCARCAALGGLAEAKA